MQARREGQQYSATVRVKDYGACVWTTWAKEQQRSETDNYEINSLLIGKDCIENKSRIPKTEQHWTQVRSSEQKSVDSAPGWASFK